MLGGFTQLGGPSPTARADGLVALAGPATSLGIGLVSAALALAVGTSGLPGTALVWLAWVSLVLAVFNLLPGAPLDGGRVLRAVLWWRLGDRDRAAMVAARAGRMLGFVLVAVGLLNAFAGSAAGLWLALVGWFIIGGATAEQAAARDEHLTGVTAADVMTPDPVVAPEWWTVDQMVAHLSPARITSGVFPVAGLDGHTTGVVTLADLEGVPATHRADTRLAVLAAHHAAPVIVTPDMDAAEVGARIRPQRGTAVVEQAERPIGVITELELSHAAHLSVLGWRTVRGRTQLLTRVTRADAAEGADQQVDVVLGGDQRRGEADGLAVRLLGEDAVVEQLLADVPAGAQLGADVDPRPQPPGPHRVDAVADELAEAGGQPGAEGRRPLLELARVQHRDHLPADRGGQRVAAEGRAVGARGDHLEHVAVGRDRRHRVEPAAQRLAEDVDVRARPPRGRRRRCARCGRGRTGSRRPASARRRSCTASAPAGGSPPAG